MSETKASSGVNSDDLQWRFCVVGNIVKSHFDENGRTLYGTAAFTGGTKVYLCGKLWRFDNETELYPR